MAKYLIVDTHGKAQIPLLTTLVRVRKLVEWTNYLIDNVYIKVGNRVYRQTVGIPMGTDCAPQLANLFLFHYEYIFMKNLMIFMAKRTVRYIDLLLRMLGSKKRFPISIPLN